MKKQHNNLVDENGLDLTQLLLTLEVVRSFNAHWKSKEIVLKFDSRNDMTQFVNLLNTMYAAGEDILEEDENEKN